VDSEKYVLEKRRVTPDIPVWDLHREGREDGPLVIVQHGYTGNKESVLTLGLQIAARGYRVLLPDARMHGDRRATDFEARFGADFMRTFLEVIDGTARDVSALIDAFAAGPVGMVGISMGAYITYIALTRDPRIETAVPFIGSPALWSPVALTPEEEARVAEVNPSAHPERFPPCAVLIQNGVEDELVPFAPVAQTYEKLVPFYADTPERLQFIPYPGVGHEVIPEMAAAGMAWLARFLPVGG
jgi:pimeloyl-ACP methyl ester carboxylesterase